MTSHEQNIPPYNHNHLFAWSEMLPRPVRTFLDNLFLEPSESHPSLTYEKLAKADDLGITALQTLKVDYLKHFTSFLGKSGIGLPLKARVQIILQTPESGNSKPLGDPGTWIIDPTNHDSVLAVGKLLLEKQQRKNLWIGFVINRDHTDPLGKKDKQTPLLGRKKPILTIEDLATELEEIAQMTKNERIENLTYKLAKIQDHNFDKLLHLEQQELLLSYKAEATHHIEATYNKTLSWEHLNKYLRDHHQTPLDPHDHLLIKLFPQDNPNWQIGDLLVDNQKLVFEFPPDKYTPRKKGDTEKSSPPRRIVLSRSKGGKPLIFATPTDLPFLIPILNSTETLERLDKALNTLGPSPYHQVQFMLNLALPPEKITSDNLTKVMQASQIDFVTDIISGVSPSNHSIVDSDNNICPYFNGITLDTLKTIPILDPSTEHSVTDANTCLKNLHLLLQRARNNSLLTTDPQLAVATTYLLDEATEELDIHLPPTINSVLRQITSRGNCSLPVSGIIRLLENKLIL